MEFNFYKEIADWSTSVIDVENDRVWLELYRHGEYETYSGGLALYNSKENTFKRYHLPSNYLIGNTAKLEDELYLEINDKVFVFSNEKFSPILTISPDINGKPALNFIEDMNDFGDFEWGV